AAARGVGADPLKAERRRFATKMQNPGRDRHHNLEMVAVDGRTRMPPSRPDLSVSCSPERADAPFVRANVRGSPGAIRSENFLGPAGRRGYNSAMPKTWIASLLFLSLCGCGPSQDKSASSNSATADTQVRALADKYVAASFERNPEQITLYGVPGHR